MALLRAEEAGLAAAQAVQAAAAEEELKELKALRHVRDAVAPPSSPCALHRDIAVPPNCLSLSTHVLRA